MTQSDQDAAALLQFAASYDDACRNGSSKANFRKLIPKATAIAPCALRLLDEPYPKGYKHSHFQPIEHEVDQCYLAILSIVPPKDRTKPIIELMHLLGAGGVWATSNCAERGWVPAVEAECDLHSEDDWAVIRWRTALLGHLSVDLEAPHERPTASLKTKPKLHSWRMQVRQLMEILRTQSYQDQPEHFAKCLQQSDSELWRVQILQSFEAAQIHADRKLLQIVAENLISQTTRIYDPDDDSGWLNSARDLTCLYQSAHRAACRVHDENLQQEFLKRIVAILPRAAGEGVHFPRILEVFEGEVPVWVRVVCDGPKGSLIIERFESEMHKPGAQSDLRSLGAYWAMTGATKAKAVRIRRTFRVQSDTTEVAYGVGLAVGYGRCTLSVSEAWVSLCEAGFGRTLQCLTAFVNGYAEARDDSRTKWSARLARQLSKNR